MTRAQREVRVSTEPETVTVAGLLLTRVPGKRRWENKPQAVFWTEEMGYIVFFHIGPCSVSSHGPTLDEAIGSFERRLSEARDALNACFPLTQPRPKVAIVESL